MELNDMEISDIICDDGYLEIEFYRTSFSFINKQDAIQIIDHLKKVFEIEYENDLDLKILRLAQKHDGCCPDKVLESYKERIKSGDLKI